MSDDLYCIDRKNPNETEVRLFLLEVNCMCPKCGKNFIKSKTKVNSYSNESAKILNKNAVLHLAPGGQELFGRSWSKISK